MVLENDTPEQLLRLRTQKLLQQSGILYQSAPYVDVCLKDSPSVDSPYVVLPFRTVVGIGLRVVNFKSSPTRLCVSNSQGCE